MTINPLDLNGDGKTDILLQNADGSLTAWLVNGNAVTGVAIGDNTDPAWRVKATGDYNGDGKADIFWLNENTGDIRLWLMDGTTRLVSRNQDLSPARDRRVVTYFGTSDFNGDGKNEVLLQRDNGSIALLEMSNIGEHVGSDSLDANNFDASWKPVVIGDFNGDGLSDIFWRKTDGQTRVWLRTPPPDALGSFNWTKTALSSLDSSFAIVGGADFNGDGKSDVLLQHSSGGVSAFLMNGASATNVVLGDNTDPAWKVKGTGDFNGDGKSDILFQNDDGQGLIWVMNGTSRYSFRQVSNPDSSLRIMPQLLVSRPGKSQDFNADGNDDILLQNDNGSLQTWLMNGNSVTGVQIGDNTDAAWRVKGMADFNDDGKTDILWQNDNGLARVWLMNGAARMVSTQLGSGDPSWKIIGTGKFNGDDNADVLMQHSNGAVGTWLMNGNSISSTATMGSNTDPAWKVKGAGDFNGDGKSDILWQNDSGQVRIWLMDGTIFVESRLLSHADPSLQVVGSGDFTGDGQADILLQDNSGALQTWVTSGSSAFGVVLGDNTDPAWKVKGTGDFNGDGKSDILWQNDSGQTRVWVMDGTSRYSFGLIGSADPSWHVVTG